MQSMKGRTDRNSEAIAVYTKAKKHELAAEYDRAFEAYLKAASLFLHLNRNTPDAKHKANAAQALERAEKIKSLKTSSRSLAVDWFSDGKDIPTRARVCLGEGAIYQWTESASLEYQGRITQPRLCPEQTALGAVWKTPELFSHVDSSVLGPEDIRQHVVTDCSICASIAVCLQHNKSLQSDLARQVLVYDEQSKQYNLRLHVNGTWRRLAIDYQLPYSNETNELVCLTSSVSSLWPSYLEKGIMRLMGGYEFPGSNSSIDLHMLVNWIPEQIEFHSSYFEREKTWSRALEGFHQGTCMATLGTGASSSVKSEVSLLPSHCYAVIDITETQEERTMTILDSWADENRLMKLAYTEILNVFEGIYLSWDPKIFQSPIVFHGLWKAGDRSKHLQLRYSEKRAGDEEEIWVLLTRHIRDTTTSSSEYVSLQVHADELSMQSLSSGHTGTYTNSTHVLVRTRVSRTHISGVLSVSASFDRSVNDSDVGFTITAYSVGAQLAWDKTLYRPPYTKTVEGAFTSKNAGGQPAYPTFMNNPQYRLKLGSTGDGNVSINMTAGKELPLHIDIVWASGERVYELSTRAVVAQSGAYSYGLARVRERLAAGEYTVVVSAFEPRYLGPYTLLVESSLPFELTPIPDEGAGLYVKTIRGSWQGAGHQPRYELEILRPNTQLRCGHYSMLQYQTSFHQDPNQTTRIRLQLRGTAKRAALNVSVYQASSSLQQQAVVTSGPYSDALPGVVTPTTSLPVGKYHVDPSVFQAGVEAEYQMLFYCSNEMFNVKSMYV